MRNFRNNRRRFRNNSFDRNLKINSNDQSLGTTFGNISDFRKKNFSRNNFNSPKLIQKYTDLAREALSTGDKILYENYMQHAEHFIRISENATHASNGKNNNSHSLNDVNIKNLSEEDSKKEEKLKLDEN